MRVVVLAILVVVSACGQGEGQRCQVEADCSGDLVCNRATGTCQSRTSGIDGSIAPDARVDAGPVDAAVDASPDASPDAGVDAP